MNQRLLRESVTLREARHAFFFLGGGVGELSFEMVFNSTIRLSHKFVIGKVKTTESNSN